MSVNKSILITGCSSGIGQACALRLDNAGFQVFAGVRRPSDAEALQAQASPSLIPLLLDVTASADIERARLAVEAACGKEGLFALINNAGFNYAAPFEASEGAKARALMETNLFGAAFLTQSMLPLLRHYGQSHRQRARIINIGSIGSLIGVPWEPWCHASKFALIGLSESLKHEMRGQNVAVTVVCPGGIRTPFIAKSEAEAVKTLAALSESQRALYGRGLQRMAALVGAVNNGGSTPEQAASVILQLLEQRDPPFRKLIGVDAHVMAALRRVLLRRVFHAIMGSIFAPAPQSPPRFEKFGRRSRP